MRSTDVHTTKHSESGAGVYKVLLEEGKKEEDVGVTEGMWTPVLKMKERQKC